jgi:hypothetical protein
MLQGMHVPQLYTLNTTSKLLLNNLKPDRTHDTVIPAKNIECCAGCARDQSFAQQQAVTGLHSAQQSVAQKPHCLCHHCDGSVGYLMVA